MADRMERLITLQKRVTEQIIDAECLLEALRDYCREYPDEKPCAANDPAWGLQVGRQRDDLQAMLDAINERLNAATDGQAQRSSQGVGDWLPLPLRCRTMQLFEIFLPLSDGADQRFPRSHYEAVETKLVRKFSGFTAYPRAPATGLWKNEDATVERDELIVYEVMTENRDAVWWSEFRCWLEEHFQQDRVLIRSHVTELL